MTDAAPPEGPPERPGSRPSTVRLPLAVVLGLLGTLWFFQGIGVAKGSVMTGDAFWAVAGVVLVVVAAALARGARKRY